MPSITSALTTFGYGRSSLLSNILILPSTGGYVIKYNSSGSITWRAYINSSFLQGVYNDSSGNIYAVGSYVPSMTINNSDGTTFGTLSGQTGVRNIFLIKYNSSGIVQWATRVSNNSNANGYSVTVDSSGNIYIAGEINATTTAFNSDTTSFATTIPTSGQSDVALIKYNTNGFVQWVARIGSVQNDSIGHIAVDSSGNIYVVGSGGYAVAVTAFNSDTSAFSPTIPALANNGVAFIIKYNTSGFVQWVTRITGNSGVGTFGYGIAVDSTGNSYVTGAGPGTTLIVYSSDTTQFGTISVSGSDAFLVKYNTNGIAQWSAKVAGTSSDTGNALTVDSSGNVYMAGSASSSPTRAFNSNGSQFSNFILNSGSGDVFIVKYNTSGSVQWLSRVASTLADAGVDLSTDSSNNVYLIGTYKANLTVFNTNDIATMQLPFIGSTSSFIVKYNSSGLPIFVSGFASSIRAETTSIRVDGSDNPILSVIVNTLA